MPLFLKYKDDTIEYEIWNVEENINRLEALLNCDQKEELERFKRSKRKKEYLCSRIILKHLFNRCVTVHYDDYGKSYIKNTDLLQCPCYK